MNNEALAIIPPAGEIEKFIGRILDGVQSDNTRRGYRRAINAFVVFKGERPGEPLSKGLLNEFKASMKAEGRGDAAINQALSAVRYFLRESAADGMIDATEADRACQVKGIQRRGVRAGNWLDKRQTEALIAAPDSSTALAIRDRAILACLIGAGLRRSECASLTVEHFQQRESRWVIVDIIGKRNKARTIPIPSWCKAIVDQWTTAAGISSGVIFRQASWSKDKFVVSETGLSDKGIARAVARWTREMGLVGIAAHDLRRTFAKLARSGGGDLEQIQLALGHESLKTTQDYLGSKLSYSDSAADRLGLSVEI
jgi:site-specific recombinase XerD